LIAQQSGAISHFTINGGYAYHLPVTRRLMLSMGISATLLNSRFDSNKAIVANPLNDILYQQYASGSMNDIALYINSGLNLYNENFYTSYSINKIIDERFDNYSSVSIPNLETTHNISMGASLSLNSHLSLHPSFLFILKELSPNTTFFSAKIFYQDQFWVGLHYSLNDATACSVGFLFNDQYKFSYTFEFAGVADRDQLGNTHEIVFGLLLNKGSSPNPMIR